MAGAREKTGFVPQMKSRAFVLKKEAPEAPVAKSASDSGEIHLMTWEAQFNAVFEYGTSKKAQLELDQRFQFLRSL